MGRAVDVAGSGLLCCSSLPSDIFIFNWRWGVGGVGGNYTPLRLPGNAPERGRMRLPRQPPLLRLLQGGGPHGACWPWWLQHPSHPLFCLFCNKTLFFFPPPPAKISPKDPPPGIVASPCIDVWLLVHMHLLFCALDFKENQRGPIMLIESCSVKRNQGLPH